MPTEHEHTHHTHKHGYTRSYSEARVIRRATTIVQGGRMACTLPDMHHHRKQNGTALMRNTHCLLFPFTVSCPCKKHEKLKGLRPSEAGAVVGEGSPRAD